MSPAEATAGFRHFHEQLSQLKQRLLDMSELATSLVDLSVEALLTRDEGKAEAVLASDRELDALDSREREEMRAHHPPFVLM